MRDYGVLFLYALMAAEGARVLTARLRRTRYDWRSL